MTRWWGVVPPAATRPPSSACFDWIDSVRPSRRAPRALLRLRIFHSAINNLPHAEERRGAPRLEARTSVMQMESALRHALRREAPRRRREGVLRRDQLQLPPPRPPAPPHPPPHPRTPLPPAPPA